MIKNILFDLDGTLLPMDQEVFVKGYFKALAAKLVPYGYEPQKLIESVWQGTYSMINNNGEHTNEEVFWNSISKTMGEKILNDKSIFDRFYEEDFPKVKATCGYNSCAKEVIDLCKEKDLKIILATNPIFPAVATHQRVLWAGLDLNDFELITTYENSSFCKPNTEYYKSICAQLNLKPEECVMVGNDVSEDMVAQALGMKTFLLTDCLINKNDADINEFNNGGFEELIEFIKVI